MRFDQKTGKFPQNPFQEFVDVRQSFACSAQQMVFFGFIPSVNDLRKQISETKNKTDDEQVDEQQADLQQEKQKEKEEITEINFELLTRAIQFFFECFEKMQPAIKTEQQIQETSQLFQANFQEFMDTVYQLFVCSGRPLQLCRVHQVLIQTIQQYESCSAWDFYPSIKQQFQLFLRSLKNAFLHQIAVKSQQIVFQQTEKLFDQHAPDFFKTFCDLVEIYIRNAQKIQKDEKQLQFATSSLYKLFYVFLDVVQTRIHTQACCNEKLLQLLNLEGIFSNLVQTVSVDEQLDQTSLFLRTLKTNSRQFDEAVLQLPRFQKLFRFQKAEMQPETPRCCQNRQLLDVASDVFQNLLVRLENDILSKMFPLIGALFDKISLQKHLVLEQPVKTILQMEQWVQKFTQDFQNQKLISAFQVPHLNFVVQQIQLIVNQTSQSLPAVFRENLVGELKRKMAQMIRATVQGMEGTEIQLYCAVVAFGFLWQVLGGGELAGCFSGAIVQQGYKVEKFEFARVNMELVGQIWAHFASIMKGYIE